jgi:hypothetical protein
MFKKDEKHLYNKERTIDILTTKFKTTKLKERYIYCDDKTLKEIKEMSYNLYEHFEMNKDILKNRKIKVFTDMNYYKWEQ